MASTDAGDASALAARLKDDVVRAGRDWALSVRGSLHREGRPAAGGWPGTLSEARQRALVLLAAHEVPPPVSTELAAALYDAARRCWLSGRDPLVADELHDD